MDYSKLRAAALQGGEDEEAVTVDTRALIDKVLARYSGEWTTLRELIQNAADAQATTVSVKWETLPSTQVAAPSTPDRSEILKHTLANHTLRRLVVQNDGQPFTKTDWGRLKRIAEGNPDETKIGAFGVGFYSVFADCEEPFVSSGNQAMAFYWKGNALFTKKTTLSPEQASPDTAFVLDYRNNTTPLPNLLSVSQFLASSLTFVALQNVEFWIDDYKILSLIKKSAPSLDLPLPRDLETRTKDGLMKVVAVDRTSTQIDASFMSVIGWKPKSVASTSKTADSYGTGSEAPSLRSFFARLTTSSSHSVAKSKAQQEQNAAQALISEDVTKLGTSTIFLRATSASIKTNVAASFASELERATKKPPPKTTKLSILTTSYDEAMASEASRSDAAVDKATDVFSSVLPSKKPGGRIFIGFPTMQTTGAGMHVSAPSVIPTVEREAIDLNARWVRSWNMELLRATGIVVRLAFAKEMEDLSTTMIRSAGGGKMTRELIAKHLPEASHIVKTFTFGDSTPSGQVGQIIEEAFWTSFKRASIEMYSSQGIMQTTRIRLGLDEVAKFVSSIPVVVSDMKEMPFVKKLIDFGLISHITVTDIKQELEAKALDKAQLIHFISWAGKKSVTGELDPGSRAALLEVAVAEVSEEGSSGDIIALGSIQNFLSSNRIPTNLPIPPTTLPYAFSANSSVAELQALGWEALEILPWLRFLLETASSRSEAQSLTRSPSFAVQVLTVLSKNWDSSSNNTKATIVQLLHGQTIMPTKTGMRKPADSFFPSVKLFDDLPVIQGCDKLKDKFLTAIGVRKTIDLDTIFTRLLRAPDEKGEKRWSHKDLVSYLASVQNDIPPDDLKKLKETRFCPAEAGVKGAESMKASEKLYKVSELYEPKDSLRSLGLPILQWPGPPGSLRLSSPEARFLAVLGLRSTPTVPELVEMMASKDGDLRTSAMTYFISNHQMNRYALFDMRDCRKPIMPLQNGTQLVQPSSCFVNESAAVLGFNVLRKDLHDHANKFGVARDPPMADSVSRLLSKPPKDQGSAVILFNYFASRMTEVREPFLSKLRDARIVPLKRRTSEKGSETITHISPAQTYLGSSPEYGDIFDFVDFGQTANAFLFHCGAKSEPTKLEIAHLLCSEPARLLSVLQSPEKYLALLKSLAESASTLHRDKELWRKMRISPFLLAYRELARPRDQETDLDEDEAPIRHYQLASAGQIVIVDDIISYRLFKDHLRCAPEEDVLEDFYMRLGAEKLSSLVEEDVRIGSSSSRPERAQLMKKHIVERSKIFLHEYVNYRRDAVKHDTKWLAANLQVEMVRSVALRRTLKGHTQSHTEKRSAAGAHERGSHWTLYIADSGTADMYQVGQAICQMILNRPNQQAYLFFEPFLTLDLYGLRARGYNVDRILRAKAAEARIAEEERRKALEEEQKRIKASEEEWNKQSQDNLPRAAEAARQVARSPEPTEPVMPGSWESPEDSKVDKSRGKNRGLLSSLGRRFGFDSQEQTSDEPEKQLQRFVDPPTSPGADSSSAAGGGMVRGNGTSSDDGKVTNPALVQQNLLEAINRTRAHGSNQVRSAASVRDVKEQANYCDETPGRNISFVASASNGVKVYVSNDATVNATQFLSNTFAAINLFAGLLVDIAHIYSVSPSAIHIFYDDSGPCIAFNTNGSLFCNLRFFLQLHAGSLRGSNPGSARAEAGTWWWVVLAHELAHNLVSLHNSEHSYYTESFIQQYMGKMMTQCARWMQNNTSGPSMSNTAAGNASASGARESTSHTQEPPPPPYS